MHSADFSTWSVMTCQDTLRDSVAFRVLRVTFKALHPAYRAKYVTCNA